MNLSANVLLIAAALAASLSAQGFTESYAPGLPPVSTAANNAAEIVLVGSAAVCVLRPENMPKPAPRVSSSVLSVISRARFDSTFASWIASTENVRKPVRR